MKKWISWLALTAVVGSAWIAVDHWEPAATTLKQSVSPGRLSAAHASLGSKCESCHETNVGVTAAKCVACHANNERLLGRQPTTFHTNIRECAACHIEHQGTHIRPVLMDHVALAKIGIRTLDRAAGKDAGSATTEASLKTWLRVKNFEHLDEKSAGEVLNCVGCHSTKDKHLGLFGPECAQCHTTTQWTISGYQHPSPRSTQCAECHQPPPSHSMMHFGMISTKIAGQKDAGKTGCCGPVEVRQCQRCHQTTSWNDIQGVGYYKHH
jgi:hypothetical protein